MFEQQGLPWTRKEDQNPTHLKPYHQARRGCPKSRTSSSHPASQFRRRSGPRRRARTRGCPSKTRRRARRVGSPTLNWGRRGGRPRSYYPGGPSHRTWRSIAAYGASSPGGRTKTGNPLDDNSEWKRLEFISRRRKGAVGICSPLRNIYWGARGDSWCFLKHHERGK